MKPKDGDDDAATLAEAAMPDITLHDLVHEMTDLFSFDTTYKAGDDAAGTETGAEALASEAAAKDDSEGAASTWQPVSLIKKRLGYKTLFKRVSSVVMEGDLDRFNAVHAAFLAQI